MKLYIIPPLIKVKIDRTNAVQIEMQTASAEYEHEHDHEQRGIRTVGNGYGA